MDPYEQCLAKLYPLSEFEINTENRSYTQKLFLFLQVTGLVLNSILVYHLLVPRNVQIYKKGLFRSVATLNTVMISLHLLPMLLSSNFKPGEEVLDFSGNSPK